MLGILDSEILGSQLLWISNDFDLVIVDCLFFILDLISEKPGGELENFSSSGLLDSSF